MTAINKNYIFYIFYIIITKLECCVFKCDSHLGFPELSGHFLNRQCYPEILPNLSALLNKMNIIAFDLNMK